jgi:hypothetical protein
MLKQILGSVILSFILSSCLSPGHSDGVVIDQNTLSPIDSTQITSEESNTVFSDSLGRFEIYRSFWTEFEILAEKKGYQPKYINSAKGDYNFNKTKVIQLQQTHKIYKPALSKNQLRFINSLIKITFSILNVLTLIFILVNAEIRWRYMWITAILFLNLIFNFLYLDFSLLGYEVIHAPFFLIGYWNNPYSLKIAVPIISIAFWILYLSKCNLVKEDIIEIRGDSERYG